MTKSIHVELTKGQSAELRDPSTLTNGQRKPFMSAAAAAQGAFAGSLAVNGEEVLEIADIALAVLIESWTYELPLPTVEDLAVLDDFAIEDYDRLMLAVGDLIPRMRWEPLTDGKRAARRATKKPK